VRIPALSRHEVEAWAAYDKLTERELYAILGSPPSAEVPFRSDENLVIGNWFKITGRSVERGRRVYAAFLARTRERVCPKWREFERQHKRKLTRVETLGLVLECVMSLAGVHFFPPPIATATLMCKVCRYRLEKLCAGGKRR